MKIDILVLNYNGKELLGLFLPSVCEAAKRSVHDCKVWVVDNASTDGSREFISNNFRDVGVFNCKENRVLFSYNDVVKNLTSDIVIFLNNDIKVKEDLVDYLAGHFANKNVFFVAPCVLNPDGTYNGGKSHFEFRWGIIKSVVDLNTYKEPGMTQMISCGAFRRETFVRLGGFNDFYAPGIWEDADLCYRGLKLGYEGLYEPRSIIWHAESTTFKKVYGSREKTILAHRNMFLFFWKNIDDPAMFLIHMIMLIPLSTIAFFRNKTEIITGFFRALPKLKTVMRERVRSKKDKSHFALNDRELILWKFL